MYKLDLPDSIQITKIRYILILKLVDPEISFIKNIPNYYGGQGCSAQ